jgi:hypothetical protein
MQKLLHIYVQILVFAVCCLRAKNARHGTLPAASTPRVFNPQTADMGQPSLNSHLQVYRWGLLELLWQPFDAGKPRALVLL